MIDLALITSNSFFKKLHLKKDEKLFQEWENNDNIYILHSGSLRVEKKIAVGDNTFKHLSNIYPGGIIGEGTLSASVPKQVQIRALQDSTLYSISAHEFKEFATTYPEIGYELMLEIIKLGNHRLLVANKEITSNYEVNLAISKIKDFTSTTIYKLLIIFQGILDVDQIMYFEKNLVMDTYFKLKYDSRKEKSIQNIIFKFENNTLNPKEISKEWNEIYENHIFVPLILWEVNYGYILVARKHTDFNDNDMRLLENTASWFIAVIHQKHIMEEERNQNYIKNA